MSTNLGFGSKLGAIKPDVEPQAPIDDRKIDAVAEQHGFTSREPIQKLSRRKPSEPSANLNIRPSVVEFNRFVRFCEENRYSYPQALKALMDKAGV